MRAYQVLITFADKRRAVMSGVFANDWNAIDMVYVTFDEEEVMSAVPRRKEAV